MTPAFQDNETERLHVLPSDDEVVNEDNRLYQSVAHGPILTAVSARGRDALSGPVEHRRLRSRAQPLSTFFSAPYPRSMAAVMMASKSLSVSTWGVPMEDARQYSSASHSRSSRRCIACSMVEP